MSRIFRLQSALLALALALVLAACGAAEGVAEGGELTFANWQWLEPERGEATWEAVTGYEAANPEVTMEQQAIAIAEYEQTLKTQMGAGEGPDILVMSDSFFPELADAGLLEPLDGVLDEQQLAALNPTNEPGERDGERFGYAWSTANYGFFWNDDILDEAGVEPPTTPEELVTASQTITEETGITGLAVRHQMNEETIWWSDFANWPYGFGGGWSDGEQLTIDSPENIAALEAYKATYDSGAFAVGDDASTFRSKFAEGQVAMMIDNSSALFVMVEGNDVVPSSSIGASPLPFPTDASAHQGIFVGINANSDNIELAKDWVGWFFTPEAQQATVDALRTIVIGTDVTPPEDFVESNPWLPTFQAQAENSRPAVIAGFELDTPTIRTIVLGQVERVLTRDVDPAEALQAAQQEAEQAVQS